MIETADLRQLIQAIRNDAVVGKFSTGGPFQDVHAVEMARYIQECPLERVPVEEHDDGAFFLIRFSDDESALTWVSVNSQSPMFQDLPRRNDESTRSHRN